MRRPKDIHNAVAVYYDGTGKFNPGHLENIPQGFVISRGDLEESLGEGAKDFARPKAAKIITEYIMSYLFG